MAIAGTTRITVMMHTRIGSRKDKNRDTPLGRRSVEERHFAAMRLLLHTPPAVTPGTGEPLALCLPMSSTNETTICYLCTTETENRPHLQEAIQRNEHACARSTAPLRPPVLPLSSYNPTGCSELVAHNRRHTLHNHIISSLVQMRYTNKPFWLWRRCVSRHCLEGHAHCMDSSSGLMKFSALAMAMKTSSFTRAGTP